MHNDGNDHWIWTQRICDWRFAKHLGISFFDISVKTGIKQFGPDWDFLLKYKKGEIGIEEYSYFYHRKVIATLESEPSLWKTFLSEPNISIACFCARGDFCHRYLFSNLLIQYLQHHGRSVTFQGELIPFTQQPEQKRQENEPIQNNTKEDDPQSRINF